MLLQRQSTSTISFSWPFSKENGRKKREREKRDDRGKAKKERKKERKLELTAGHD